MHLQHIHLMLCVACTIGSSHTHSVCVTLEAKLQQSGQQWVFCSILPGGSAVWRIKSPTCLCFTDLCCPGNRCRDFPFLHFFSSVHYPYRTPHHHCCQTPPLHSTRGCFLPHDLPHSTISHTHRQTHTHFARNFQCTAVISQCHRTEKQTPPWHIYTENLRVYTLLWPWPCCDSEAEPPSVLQHSEPQEGKKRGGAGEVEETKREQLKSRTSGSKNKAGCTLCFILLFVWASKNVNFIYKAQTIAKFAMLPFDVITICSTWQPLIVVVSGGIWLVINVGMQVNEWKYRMCNQLEQWTLWKVIQKSATPHPRKCSSNWLMGWNY